MAELAEERKFTKVVTPNRKNDSDTVLQHSVRSGNTQVFVKRLFDVIVSSTVLICILSWLTPLLYIVIKLGSRGPLLFKQHRVGLRGHVFTCYKFRTMVVNRESDLVDTRTNDVRITTAGRVLRKTHLDELPQMINVLVGDMSIIGPRPHMLYDHDKFCIAVPNYDTRHLVKPGITGLAQVKGYHGTVSDFHSIQCRTRLDLFYVRNASLTLDTKLLLKTLVVANPVKKLFGE